MKGSRDQCYYFDYDTPCSGGAILDLVIIVLLLPVRAGRAYRVFTSGINGLHCSLALTEGVQELVELT